MYTYGLSRLCKFIGIVNFFRQTERLKCIEEEAVFLLLIKKRSLLSEPNLLNKQDKVKLKAGFARLLELFVSSCKVKVHQ